MMRPLTNQEYRLLKRIAEQGPVAMESMTAQDKRTFKSLVALGYVRPLTNQPGNPVDYPGKVLIKESKDESYKRYKYLCYRNLILESFLTFILGLLVAYVLKLR